MDDNFNEKISLDDLFVTKEANQKNTIKIFQKILARAHKKIKTAARNIEDIYEDMVDEELTQKEKENTKDLTVELCQIASVCIRKRIIMSLQY